MKPSKRGRCFPGCPSWKSTKKPKPRCAALGYSKRGRKGWKPCRRAAQRKEDILDLERPRAQWVRVWVCDKHSKGGQ